MTANSQTCRKCGSPVTPVMKFCESCGAKIEALPACRQCGAPLEPDVKFCESCGTPVDSGAGPAKPAPAGAALVPAPSFPAPETPPVQETTPPDEPMAIPAVPAEKAVPPESPAKAEEKPVSAPAPVHEPAGAGKQKEQKIPAGSKKPLPQPTMILAGVIVLALIGAAVYFIVLPLFSGGTSPAGTANPPVIPGLPVTKTPTAPSGVPAGSSGGPVSFVTEPTQIPPANLVVTFQAERDPITGVVTVTYTGGARYAVKDVFIRLTRSDGQAESKTITLAETGQIVTLQGTKTGDDRIEVTANYYNGEQYRVIDRVFEYKKRDW